jgi:protein TonB
VSLLDSPSTRFVRRRRFRGRLLLGVIIASAALAGLLALLAELATPAPELAMGLPERRVLLRALSSPAESSQQGSTTPVAAAAAQPPRATELPSPVEAAQAHLALSELTGPSIDGSALAPSVDAMALPPLAASQPRQHAHQADAAAEPGPAPVSAPVPAPVQTPPALRTPVDPDRFYPLAARRRGQQGWTRIEVAVNAQGGVDQVEVLAAQPSGVFDDAARRLGRSLHFTPATRDGMATAGRHRLVIRWELQ